MNIKTTYRTSTNGLRRKENIMGIVTVKNLSTLTDGTALVRVGIFMNGEVTRAVTDDRGKEIIKIKWQNGTYTVTDKEE